MSDKKIIVAGAGLAGLTSAINLARDGYEVLVLDKEARYGGRPEFRPDGAASVFDFAAIEAYTGIDIKPACRKSDLFTMVVYGKRIEFGAVQGEQSYMVERGPRSSSIDSLLHDTAVDAGVKFEWGRAMKSPEDIAELPEGSIIATGLDVQGFEATGIPYVPLWGWYAKGMTDEDRTLSWGFVDDYTIDYGFVTIVNNTAFALLFQRDKPMTKRDKEQFERAVEAEGLEFSGWADLYGGAAPHRCIDNPILFKNNMIIAGTLAGVMEPMMNFGMLGALLSGKIAAIAVTDRGKAYDEFTRLTGFFRMSMRAKRLQDRAPAPLRKAFWGLAATALSSMGAENRNKMFSFVPGYRNFDGSDL